VDILVVVDVVPWDINNIGSTTAKVIVVIRQHKIQSRGIAGIDPQHGNVVHNNPGLQHNHNMYNDRDEFNL
jgi:hypothetical protein